jgi:hypothetical protein
MDADGGLRPSATTSASVDADAPAAAAAAGVAIAPERSRRAGAGVNRARDAACAAEEAGPARDWRAQRADPNAARTAVRRDAQVARVQTDVERGIAEAFIAVQLREEAIQRVLYAVSRCPAPADGFEPSVAEVQAGGAAAASILSRSSVTKHTRELDFGPEGARLTAAPFYWRKVWGLHPLAKIVRGLESCARALARARARVTDGPPRTATSRSPTTRVQTPTVSLCTCCAASRATAPFCRPRTTAPCVC